jgi:hypothetical protein
MIAGLSFDQSHVLETGTESSFTDKCPRGHLVRLIP